MAALIGVLAWLGVLAFPVGVIAGIVCLPSAYKRWPVRTVVISVVIGLIIGGGILLIGASNTI